MLFTFYLFDEGAWEWNTGNNTDSPVSFLMLVMAINDDNGDLILCGVVHSQTLLALGAWACWRRVWPY